MVPLAPSGAARRVRLGRLLRAIDVYVVFALIGIVTYIVVVNIIAEGYATDIEMKLNDKVARGTMSFMVDFRLPREVYWPYHWPASPAPAMKILRDGRTYVEQSLNRLAPLLPRHAEVKLAVWDLLLLTGQKTGVDVSAVELQRVVAAVVPSSATAAGVVAAAREAVESAAAVWAAKGSSAEVTAAQRIADELLAEPTLSPPLFPPTPASELTAASWGEWSDAVWKAATAHSTSVDIEIREAYEQLLKAVRLKEVFALDGTGLLPLQQHHLMAFQGGSYDAVVPVTRLLLQLWLLGGRADAALAAAYHDAITYILRKLLLTRTVSHGGREMNFTFVASAAEGHIVPVATPRTCALAGVLAQGVRFGVHKRQSRAAAGGAAPPGFSEDEVLQAAEALAVSCFQQYVDPAGFKLREAVYVTSSGPSPGFVALSMGPESRHRSTACDIPTLLLEAFHELYLATEDAMYGLWSLLVMTNGTSDHCNVEPRDLIGSAAWLRYVRELRALWLLLQHMDCLLYRRSHGTRGLCDVTATTMVSPLTGHLRRLPRAKAAART